MSDPDAFAGHTLVFVSGGIFLLRGEDDLVPMTEAPVISIDCSVYPRRRRSSKTSRFSSWSSRPTKTGGRAPALGV